MIWESENMILGVAFLEFTTYFCTKSTTSDVVLVSLFAQKEIHFPVVPHVGPPTLSVAHCHTSVTLCQPKRFLESEIQVGKDQ